MSKIFKKADNEVAEIINSGGIGVMPTDTIYGLVGSALNRKSVEKIYKVKKRDKNSPVIVLISSVGDLEKFDIETTSRLSEFLKRIWPGPVSVIIPCSEKKFKYVHRGKESIAFRLPALNKLRSFIKKTGPLVAPSANLSGLPPAKNIKEAREYFNDNVDFYVDSGKVNRDSSLLVEIKRF